MILARGVSGLVEIGITDGLKMSQTLKRITSNKANDKLIAELWSKFWLINSRASAIIETAAAFNPKLADFLERIRMKAKDATPDPDVKDAEPC